MACLGTLKGINTSCAGNIGGIQKVFIADFDGVTVTPGYEAGSDIPNTVSSITASTGTKFYTYVLENEVNDIGQFDLSDDSSGVFHVRWDEIELAFAIVDDLKFLEAVEQGSVFAKLIGRDHLNDGKK